MFIGTLEQLRKLFSVDENEGILTWNYRTDFLPPGYEDRWNTKFAGKIAGGYDGGGYLRIGIQRKLYGAHRICFALYNKIDLEDVPPEVDHENGIKDDNRKLNLRPSCRLTNSRNKTKHKNNTTGFKGVNIHKSSGRIRVSIMVGGKQHEEYGFNTLEQAYDRYLELAREKHKQFACGNEHGE